MLNRRAYLCPKCGMPSKAFETKTNPKDGVIQRVRMCQTCQLLYNTVEMVVGVQGVDWNPWDACCTKCIFIGHKNDGTYCRFQDKDIDDPLVASCGAFMRKEDK